MRVRHGLMGMYKIVNVRRFISSRRHTITKIVIESKTARECGEDDSHAEVGREWNAAECIYGGGSGVDKDRDHVW